MASRLSGWRRVITMTLFVAAAVAAPCVAGADRLAVPGSHLYYEVHGSGPPVVLIHGGNLDAGMWDADVPVLAKTFRVVTYDACTLRPLGPADGRLCLARGPPSPARSPEDRSRGSRRAVTRGAAGDQLRARLSIAHLSNQLVLAGPGVDGWPWRPIHSSPPWWRPPRPAMSSRRPRYGSGIPQRLAPAMRDPAVATRVRQLAARNQHIWLQPIGPAVVPSPPALTRLGEIRAPTLVLVGTLDVADIQGTAEAADGGRPRGAPRGARRRRPHDQPRGAGSLSRAGHRFPVRPVSRVRRRPGRHGAGVSWPALRSTLW